MLLTSSQVSVAVSSCIVVLCTTALFLSGYVLQQRTLRDLREAIAPRSSPKVHLPDRFQQSTTELEDGTIIVLDDGQEREQVVEVRPTPPEQKALAGGQQGGPGSGADNSEQLDGSETGQKPMSRAERRRRIKEEIMKSSQRDKPNTYRPRRLW